MKDITENILQQFQQDYAADKAAQTLHAALAKADMADLAYVPEAAAKLKGAFSVEVKTRGITAQQKSGRCWLFAALNILREKVAKNAVSSILSCHKIICRSTISSKKPITSLRWSSSMQKSPSRASSCSMFCAA